MLSEALIAPNTSKQFDEYDPSKQLPGSKRPVAVNIAEHYHKVELGERLPSGLSHIQVIDFTKSDKFKENMKLIADSRSEMELRLSKDYLKCLAEALKGSREDELSDEFLDWLRNASSLVGIGAQTKNTTAFECDFRPVTGTSVIVEVEVTDSDESEEDDDRPVLKPKADHHSSETDNVFQNLNSILHPEDVSEKFNDRLSILGQTSLQLIPRRKYAMNKTQSRSAWLPQIVEDKDEEQNPDTHTTEKVIGITTHNLNNPFVKKMKGEDGESMFNHRYTGHKPSQFVRKRQKKRMNKTLRMNMDKKGSFDSKLSRLMMNGQDGNKKRNGSGPIFNS